MTPFSTFRHIDSVTDILVVSLMNNIFLKEFSTITFNLNQYQLRINVIFVYNYKKNNIKFHLFPEMDT